MLQKELVIRDFQRLLEGLERGWHLFGKEQNYVITIGLWCIWQRKIRLCI